MLARFLTTRDSEETMDTKKSGGVRGDQGYYGVKGDQK